MSWKVREGLIAYTQILQAAARDTYRFELLRYAIGALDKKPSKPEILSIQ